MVTAPLLLSSALFCYVVVTQHKQLVGRGMRVNVLDGGKIIDRMFMNQSSVMPQNIDHDRHGPNTQSG